MKDRPEKAAHPIVSRRDIVLWLIILCAAGMLFILGGVFSGGDEVVITVDKEEYGRYSIHENRVINIMRDGMENIVEIKDGRVHMKSASCPDHLCVHQGYIDSGIHSIVCLPNRVVVEVESR